MKIDKQAHTFYNAYNKELKIQIRMLRICREDTIK